MFALKIRFCESGLRDLLLHNAYDILQSFEIRTNMGMEKLHTNRKMYLLSANDYYLTHFMTFGFTCLRLQNCGVNGEKKEYSYNMLISHVFVTKENRMKKTLGVSCYVTHSRLT